MTFAWAVPVGEDGSGGRVPLTSGSAVTPAQRFRSGRESWPLTTYTAAPAEEASWPHRSNAGLCLGGGGGAVSQLRSAPIAGVMRSQQCLGVGQPAAFSQLGHPLERPSGGLYVFPPFWDLYIISMSVMISRRCDSGRGVTVAGV